MAAPLPLPAGVAPPQTPAQIAAAAAAYYQQLTQHLLPNEIAAPTSGHAFPTMTLPAGIRRRAGWHQYTPAEIDLYMTTFEASAPHFPPNLQGRFVGGKMLGEGGSGCAGLWLEVDASDKIVRRIVVKNCKINPRAYVRSMFYYNIGNPARSIPMEAYCQTIAGPMAGTASSNVCELLSWAVDDIDHTWRFYSEYAPFGNVDDLINQSLQTRAVWKKPPGSKRKRRLPDEGPRALPEPFLWAVFDGLARAAIDMENPPNLGALGRPNGLTGGNQGTEIVHTDLKPGNVFFGDRVPGPYAWYPQIKVGDFGNSGFTSGHDWPANNPKLFLGIGTPGFEPPELVNVDNTRQRANARQPPSMHPRYCSAKANIWQIGMIMRCLMRLDTEVTQGLPANHTDFATVPPFRDPPVGSAAGTPRIDNWVPRISRATAPGNYSHELINLTRACLNGQAANRPTPTALLASVTANGGSDGLDTRVNPFNRPLVPGHPHAVTRLNQKKVYAVGMSARGFP